MMIKQTSVHSLQEEGYTEDHKSLRRFERRYGLFSAGGVVLFFYGFYLTATRQEALGLINPAS
jgi:hypothetical protein